MNNNSNINQNNSKPQTGVPSDIKKNIGDSYHSNITDKNNLIAEKKEGPDSYTYNPPSENITEKEQNSEKPQELQQTNKQKPKALIHTYKTDVENLVKKQKLSLIKMVTAQADADKRELFELNPKKETKKRKSNFMSLIPAISFSLIFIGIVALSASYYVYFTPSPQPSLPQSYKTFFFTDKTETLDITEKTPESIKRALITLRDTSFYPKGSVVNMVLVTSSQEVLQPITLRKFFEIFNARFPEEYKNYLSDNFMFGWYSSGDKNLPFLVIKTSSFDYTFAGLLNWEDKMEDDFYPIFTVDSISIKEKYGGTKFTDSTLANVDVRVQKDSKGQVRLIYGFVKNDTVLITVGVTPFVEITKRLRATN